MAGVLTFAENGYYIEKKSGGSRFHELPQPLQAKLVNSAKVYCIAIGTGRNFFCSWKDEDGKMWKFHQLSNYRGLGEYLTDKDRSSRFNYEEFHCSLGPNGSFYLVNSATGAHKHIPDPTLLSEINSRREDGYYAGDPAQVMLGIEGSYVLLGKKGDIFWDLKGHYGKLDKTLQEAKLGIQTITLSLFNNEHWYVLFKDGSSQWSTGKQKWDLNRYN